VGRIVGLPRLPRPRLRPRPALRRRNVEVGVVVLAGLARLLLLVVTDIPGRVVRLLLVLVPRVHARCHEQEPCLREVGATIRTPAMSSGPMWRTACSLLERSQGAGCPGSRTICVRWAGRGCPASRTIAGRTLAK